MAGKKQLTNESVRRASRQRVNTVVRLAARILQVFSIKYIIAAIITLVSFKVMNNIRLLFKFLNKRRHMHLILDKSESAEANQPLTDADV